MVPNPKVPDISCLLSDGDCHTIALVAYLHKELAELCQWVDSYESSAAQAEGDYGEDDKHLAVWHHMWTFLLFVTNMLPDYVLQIPHIT